MQMQRCCNNKFIVGKHNLNNSSERTIVVYYEAKNLLAPLKRER